MKQSIVPLTSLVLLLTFASARAADGLALDRPGGWVLKSMTRGGEDKPALAAGGQASLAVAGHRVHGSAGINSYSGTVRTTARGGFRVREIGMTEMGGDPAAMKQESMFIDLLMQATEFRVADGELVLSDGAGENQLRFAAKGGAPAGDLAGTKWTLAGFEDRKGQTVSFAAPLGGTTLTLSFDAEGKVAGSGGVNRFFGGYKVRENDGVVEIGPLASTKRAGPAGQIQQERRYFEALGSTALYRIEGGRLILSDSAGDTRLVFAAGG